MRVLIIGSRVLDPYLGPSSVAHNTLTGFLKIQEELQNNEIKISFLSFNDNKSENFGNNISVVGTEMHHPITVTGDIQVLLKKPKEKFDIIHSHLIFVSPQIQKSKIIFNIHGIPWKTFPFSGYSEKIMLKIFEKLLRLYFPSFSKVIVPSRYCFNELSAKGYQSSKIIVIENPVSEKFFNIKKREDSIILYPAVITPRKNQIGFLRALAIVKEDLRDFSIIFTGGGDRRYIEILREFIQKNELKNIKFTGKISYDQIIELHARASIVALTSFYESAGVALMEAMAAGTPVLGSNIAGIPCIVDNGRTGLLADPYNPHDIAEKLLILVSDDRLRKRIGEEAKAEAERRWRDDIIARELLKLYLEVFYKE